LRSVRRSSRLTEGWERDGGRLFLSPNLYSEAILIQYLVSRSHTHGGTTLEGRLTLMDLIRRLRYSGYLDQIGIIEREPGEVFEKLIDHLAAKHEWSEGSKPVAPARKTTTKKAAKKTAKKSRKAGKPAPEEVVSETVKLHYLIDRRDFLEKVKRVYAAYA
jgi:hypothetical protein